MPQLTTTSCPPLIELERFVQAGASDMNVRAHLEQCDDCHALVGEIQENNELLDRVRRSTIDSPRTIDSSLTADAIELAGIEILDEVCRGGQGVVFRARQRATNRIVALKVLLAGAFATSRQLARFEREIELIAALEHPNIVAVYDSGRTADGRLYLVMRYIDGVRLDEWLSASRADTPESIVKLFCGICQGVTHAHQRGVIHRDLKPANILVDEEGTPHIVDFGLAKDITIADEHEHRRSVTAAGQFMGTLAYAAPEQLTGEASDTDVRSDVYSIGAMLYEALSGTLPVSVEGDLASVIDRIRDDAPPKLHDRRVETAIVVDRDLDTIVQKSLSKEKDRRYQSVAALHDDLQHWLAREPINARRDSTWYVLSRTLQRHRLATLFGAAVLLLIVGFGVAMSFAYDRARTEAEKAAQIRVFLEDTLGSVESARGGEDVTVRELLDEAVQWIDIALADQPEVAAAIQTTVGNSYRNLGLVEKAEEQLQRGLRTRVDLFGEDHPQVAESLSTIALLRIEQGQLNEARTVFERVLEIRDRTLGRDNRSTAITLANLGLVHRDLGNYEEAQRFITESLDIRRRLFGELHSDVAMCYFNLATIAEREQDWKRAASLHEQSLDVRRRVLSPQHPDMSRSLLALGTVTLHLGEAEHARPLLAECLHLRRQLYGPNHWKFAEATVAMAEYLIAAGESQTARELLTDAIRNLELSAQQADLHQRALDLLRAVDQ